MAPAPVGQPGPAGDRAGVDGGDGAGWLAEGEEHRARGAAGQQSGQEDRGAGLPVHPVGGSAFGRDAAAFAGLVEVGYIEAKDFLGAGGGLVQHPPQVLSRSGTFSAQIASTWARVSARVVSGVIFGRAHPAVGLVATQPVCAHQVRAERSAARCRARVAAASVPNAAVNASSSAAAPSGVPSTAMLPAAAGAVPAS